MGPTEIAVAMAAVENRVEVFPAQASPSDTLQCQRFHRTTWRRPCLVIATAPAI